MKDFIYDIPTKVYFGQNQLEHLGEELKKYGKRVLMTYGGGSVKRIGLYDKIKAEIEKAGLVLFELSDIEPNPRIDSVRKGGEICKKEHIDVLLAVGGGSTIDCTKFIAASAYYAGDPWDFFSKRVPIENSLPIISVLTLSATGSEMDPGGVISNMETKDKLARAEYILRPKASFLDPTVTYTVGEFQTACGSCDILSHLIETYFNPNGSMFMLDSVMEGLMKTVIKYAPIAVKEPDNYEARANLMWASSWAINGFVRTCQVCNWSCHPIEHELSAIYDITHGLGLAILTPRWMEYVLNEETAERFYKFGTGVFDIDKNLEPMAVAEKSIEQLSEFFFKTLKLKSTLGEIGIDDKHFAHMAKKSCSNGVLNGFVPLKAEDIEKIYKMCL